MPFPTATTPEQGSMSRLTIIAAYRMIPNSQLSIIPDAPHPVFLANFPAVWASTMPFLQH
ncbi:hypothetical protein [Spirosoma agri]|uniref:hypothetical protein n=1 Tax=Spirosoma agri TaxID=1987381 RepID=UPI001BAFCC19|nr:hypothetical protein [Spirosoma agri]